MLEVGFTGKRPLSWGLKAARVLLAKALISLVSLEALLMLKLVEVF
jgi:hypothetical protein